MRMGDMIWGFVPGGEPKDLGRKAKSLAHFAVGMAGVVVCIVPGVAITVLCNGPAAVINTLMDATKKGGQG